MFYRDIDKCCLAGHEDNVTSSRVLRHQLYIWRDVLVVELNVLFQARIEVAVKVVAMRHQPPEFLNAMSPLTYDF